MEGLIQGEGEIVKSYKHISDFHLPPKMLSQRDYTSDVKKLKSFVKYLDTFSEDM